MGRIGDRGASDRDSVVGKSVIAATQFAGSRVGRRAIASAIMSGGCSRSAPCGVAKCSTCLSKPRRFERGDLPPESVTWNRVDVVEVDDAIGGNTVVGRQFKLRDQTSDHPRDGCHDD